MRSTRRSGVPARVLVVLVLAALVFTGGPAGAPYSSGTWPGAARALQWLGGLFQPPAAQADTTAPLAAGAPAKDRALRAVGHLGVLVAERSAAGWFSLCGLLGERVADPPPQPAYLAGSEDGLESPPPRPAPHDAVAVGVQFGVPAVSVSAASRNHWISRRSTRYLGGSATSSATDVALATVSDQSRQNSLPSGSVMMMWPAPSGGAGS